MAWWSNRVLDKWLGNNRSLLCLVEDHWIGTFAGTVNWFYRGGVQFYKENNLPNLQVSNLKKKRWRIRTSGIWHCVAGYFPLFRRNFSLPSSRILRGPWTPEELGNTFLRNVRNHLPRGAVSHPGRPEYTSTLYMWYIVRILMLNTVYICRLHSLLLTKKIKWNYVC